MVCYQFVISGLRGNRKSVTINNDGNTNNNFSNNSNNNDNNNNSSSDNTNNNENPFKTACPQSLVHMERTQVIFKHITQETFRTLFKEIYVC